MKNLLKFSVRYSGVYALCEQRGNSAAFSRLRPSGGSVPLLCHMPPLWHPKLPGNYRISFPNVHQQQQVFLAGTELADQLLQGIAG